MAVKVEITRRAVLRASPPPAESTHGGGGGGDGGGNQSPLSPFDLATTNDYIPNVFAWKASAPDNDALVDGLLAAVARYPHMSARLGVDGRGRKCFILNDAGLLVVEATADADLADALAAHHDVLAAHIHELYPKADKERADEPLLQVQLTRYKCGGLVIGAMCQHLVVDGYSISSFYAAWATTVRIRSAAASGTTTTDNPPLPPPPFTDRVAIAVPRSPPAPKFDHRNIEFAGHSYPVVAMDRIKSLTITFPADFIAELKARVDSSGDGDGDGGDGGRCTTFQCVLAHAWKKITAARGVPPEEFTKVRVAVNCRRCRASATDADAQAPAVAAMDKYFGNMVLWAFPRMRAAELLTSSYAAVVTAIRDAVASIDAEYIQSFVDFVAGAVEEEEELVSAAPCPGTAFCPDIEVDSWLGLGLHDPDFGYGPPCAFLQPELPVEGLMILVPSCAAAGGVDLSVALDVEHVDAFKRICYSMDD